MAFGLREYKILAHLARGSGFSKFVRARKYCFTISDSLLALYPRTRKRPPDNFEHGINRDPLWREAVDRSRRTWAYCGRVHKHELLVAFEAP